MSSDTALPRPQPASSPGTEGAASTLGATVADDGLAIGTGFERFLRERGRDLLVRAAVAAGLATAATILLDRVVGWSQRVSAAVGIGVVAAGSLVAVAVTHFEAFVLAALGMRASLDVLKASDAGIASYASPATLLGGLFVVTSALWLLAQRQRHPLTWSWASRTTLVFAVATGISAMAASDLGASSYEVVRLLAVVAMLLVLEQIARDPLQRRRALVMVFAAAAVPIAVGLYQLAAGSGVVVDGLERVRGTFLHSNPFAMFLALVGIMGVAVAPTLSRRAQVLLAGLGLAGAVCLAATYTRGAWAAAAVGVLVVAVVQRRRLVAFGLLLAVIGLLLAPGVSDRLGDLTEDRWLNGRPANSLEWRLDHWRDAAVLAEESPVFGVGFGMVAQETPAAKPTHNDFVRAYAELGAVGLAAYLAMLAGFVTVAAQAVRRARGRLDRAIAAGTAGCVAAFLVLSLSANVISQVVVVWYLVAFIALAAGVVASARSARPEGRR